MASLHVEGFNIAGTHIGVTTASSRNILAFRKICQQNSRRDSLRLQKTSFKCVRFTFEVRVLTVAYVTAVVFRFISKRRLLTRGSSQYLCPLELR